MNAKEDSFREIYEQNFDYIYNYVYSRLAGDSSNVEDLVQEIFFAVARSLKSYEGKSSIKTWLYSIAKHKIIDYYRKEISKRNLTKTGNFFYEIRSERIQRDFTSSMQQDEGKEKVIGVLNKMSQIYKYSLLLKYIDGYSVKEISRILKKTPKAIDGILQRAKAEFKEYFLNKK
jgi:RNA polymerase sigma-70 factor (ECF subfamily)